MSGVVRDCQQVPERRTGNDSAAVRSMASEKSSLVALPLSEAPFAKRDTVSTPAATKTSPSPARIACAAMRMVWSEDEQ